MSFEPRMLENGDILVFSPAYSGGKVGDGGFVVKKGTPEYEKALAEIEELKKKNKKEK